MVDEVTIEVPARFWVDHVDRGLRCDARCPYQEEHQAEQYGKKTARGYTVPLSAADIVELRSDAEHYSDYAAWGSPEGIGLQSSARATVRRLDRHANVNNL